MNRLSILFILVFASCTHSVHMVHTGDFGNYEKLTSGTVVKSTAEQFVILGFTSETNYIDEAKKKLEDQCAGGTIQGVTSRLSTSHGFFSWTNKLHLEGLCIN